MGQPGTYRTSGSALPAVSQPLLVPVKNKCRSSFSILRNYSTFQNVSLADTKKKGHLELSGVKNTYGYTMMLGEIWLFATFACRRVTKESF